MAQHQGQGANGSSPTMQWAFTEHASTQDVVDTTANKAGSPCFYEAYPVIKERGEYKL